MEQTNSDLITQATEAAKRLEEANAKKEALLKQEEALYAKKLLGGRSDTNVSEPQKTPEQLQKEEIDRNANLLANSLGRSF